MYTKAYIIIVYNKNNNNIWPLKKLVNMASTFFPFGTALIFFRLDNWNSVIEIKFSSCQFIFYILVVFMITIIIIIIIILLLLLLLLLLL